MNTNEKPGQSPGKGAKSTGRGLFRRRVVFELDEAQLPLLEAAEERHGSKRAALIAALEAEEEAAELPGRAARAEADAAEQGQRAEREGKKGANARAKLERELADAREKLVEAEKARALAGEEDTEIQAQLRAELGELRDELGEAEAELEELRPCAVDRLYCERCGKWVAPEEWSWGELEDGGTYAFHGPCGDHGEGRGGSSWLALRC